MKSTPKLASPPRRMKPAPQLPDDQLNDKIRLRAYELFERRGAECGHELDDWLRAESELTRRKPNGT